MTRASSVVQAAALRAFGLPVQTTPALRQSAMQLSLGMGVGKGLNLDSWQYGSEGPSVSMVLEAMTCHASDAVFQPGDSMAKEGIPASNAEVRSHPYRWMPVFSITSATILACQGLSLGLSLGLLFMAMALSAVAMKFLTPSRHFAGRQVPRCAAHLCYDARARTRLCGHTNSPRPRA